jgi:hypothetical protein
MNLSEILESISNLFDFALMNSLNELRMVDIGVIDAELASKIAENTGYLTENYIVSIDSFGIKHSMNGHSVSNEVLANQIGITKNDFLLLHQIIFSADNIIKGIKHKNTQPDTIFFEKTIKNKYEVVLEIRMISGKKKALYKKNRLILKNMYICEYWVKNTEIVS